MRAPSIVIWLAPMPDGGAARDGYGFVGRALSRERLQQLLDQRPHGASFNDVLLAASMLTVERWNAAHGIKSDRVSARRPLGACTSRCATALSSSTVRRPWRSSICSSSNSRRRRKAKHDAIRARRRRRAPPAPSTTTTRPLR